MSDEIKPVAPVARVEPVSPVAGLRDVQPGLYQIFAVQLASFMETFQQPPPPAIPSPLFPSAVPFPPLPLRRRRIERKKKGTFPKVEAISQESLKQS